MNYKCSCKENCINENKDNLTENDFYATDFKNQTHKCIICVLAKVKVPEFDFKTCSNEENCINPNQGNLIKEDFKVKENIKIYTAQCIICERNKRKIKRETEESKKWSLNYRESEHGKTVRYKARGYKYKDRFFTHEDYKILYEEQKGNCAICNTNYDKLEIDHCHNSQEVRGLLCIMCNVALGGFMDKKDNLINAINYLEKNGI